MFPRSRGDCIDGKRCTCWLNRKLPLNVKRTTALNFGDIDWIESLLVFVAVEFVTRPLHFWHYEACCSAGFSSSPALAHLIPLMKMHSFEIQSWVNECNQFVHRHCSSPGTGSIGDHWPFLCVCRVETVRLLWTRVSVTPVSTGAPANLMRRRRQHTAVPVPLALTVLPAWPT